MPVGRFVATLTHGMLAATAVFGLVAVSPIAPTAHADGNWGAIAVSNDFPPHFGFGNRLDSRSRAEHEALDICADYGGYDCYVKVSDHDTCMAVAYFEEPGRDVYFVYDGVGATQADAENDALDTSDNGTFRAIGDGSILSSMCTN